jgi:enoyl-CoA hydratase/carnithine racemase
MAQVNNESAGQAQVELTRINHVAVVTINRPRRMNALDPAASAAMSAIWDQIRDDDDIWAAVLTGSGERAFCVGFDLKWGAENPGTPLADLNGPNGFGGLTHRRDLYKPIVAAVTGYCLGGGFELALACDLVVAGQGASFGCPEPKVGNVAAWGGVQRLARMLPRSVANRVLLAGQFLTAQEAATLGIVHEVTADDGVLDTAIALAQHLCQSAPLALQATKALYLDALDKPLSQSIAEAPAHPAMIRLQVSDDHEEGNRAFAERREPQWTGK